MAMKPLKASSPDGNLFKNGDFANWPDDLRIPVDWTHAQGYPTLDEAPSKIERFKDGTYDKWYAAKQTWTKPDGEDSIFRQFGITVSGLKPETNYRLVLKAWNQSKNTIVVLPWSVENPASGDGSHVKCLSLPFIEIPPSDGFVDYGRTFQTDADTTAVRFVTASPGKENYPVSVIWDRWVLTEVGSEAENLIQNGNFGNWPSDVRLPIGFAHGFGYSTLDDIPAAISPVDVPTLHARAAQETWRKPDGADSIFRLFGVTVENLKPNTLYRLSVSAYNTSKSDTVFVSPWAVGEKESDPVLKLAQPGIEVKPGAGFGYLDYAIGFKTGPNDTRVRIVASSNAAGVTVYWREWRLTEAGSAQ